MTTMYIHRALSKILSESRKSILLLGPRQTGKSTLIRRLNPNLTINLAHEQTYLDFAKNPSELEQRLHDPKNIKTIFIDEVQRLPSLLNTIQSMMDEELPFKFYLTGSSARKLKRGKANLLPGRIHIYYLGPLSFEEVGEDFKTQQAMETGTLPGIYLESVETERTKTLRAYSATYLKEEIQAEALTRNLEGFSRFLFVMAHWSGRFIDFSKLTSEAQISRQSAMRYFEILEDTLVIDRCPPFSKSERKRLVQHPKFFFFDNGVLNGLLGNFTASEDRKGLLFEHFFFNQLVSTAHHKDQEWRISTYRTEHGAEVDFIVESKNGVWAIELKASDHLSSIDVRGFESFSQFYGRPHRHVVAHLGKIEKTISGVPLLPWQKVIKEL